MNLCLVSESAQYGRIHAPMDTIPEHGSRWRRIVNEVAEKRHIPASHILGSRRWRFVAKARNECYYRIRNEVTNRRGKPVSWRQIGRWMDRNMSTVRQGCLRYAAAQTRPA